MIHLKQALKKKRCLGKSTPTIVEYLHHRQPHKAKVCLKCGRVRQYGITRNDSTSSGDTSVLVYMSDPLKEWLNGRTLPPGAYYFSPKKLYLDAPERGVGGVYMVVVPNPLRIKWHKHYNPEVYHDFISFFSSSFYDIFILFLINFFFFFFFFFFFSPRNTMRYYIEM